MKVLLLEQGKVYIWIKVVCLTSYQVWWGREYCHTARHHWLDPAGLLTIILSVVTAYALLVSLSIIQPVITAYSLWVSFTATSTAGLEVPLDYPCAATTVLRFRACFV